jgi:ribosomal-protein-alanine N-acetyltransferase
MEPLQHMEFSLRPWAMDDLESLVKYANNYEIARNLMDRFPHPYTHENGKTFINMAMDDAPPHVFAIVIGGEAAGGIGLHPEYDVFRKNAELGYWLGQPFWGKGIMVNAVKQMVEYGFHTLDINRIFARPFGSNLASQRVLQKAGFTLEAELKSTIYKNGEYQDELIYAVRRG